MKIKSILGLVLCVLLTASVGHAASSNVVITGTSLTVSGGHEYPALVSAAGEWANVTADTTTPTHVVGADVVADSGWQTVYTQTYTVIATGNPAVYSLDFSVEEILAVTNPVDYALSQWAVDFTLTQDLYASGGGGTRVVTDSDSGTFGISGLTDETVTETPDTKTLTVSSAATGGKAVTLTISVYARAGAYEGEVTVDDPQDPNPNPIPAPGAVLLSSLGAGLVGWMRRRKTL